MQKPTVFPLSEAIEYVGRWEITEDYAAATACGSSFRLAFRGSTVVLVFDTSFCQPAFPHIYISVDGGAMTECTVEPYIRVWARDGGRHEVTVILKSTIETQDRWNDPKARVSFIGALGAEPERILPDTRAVIEFVGDSITEGNSVNPSFTPIEGARWIENLVYTNDIASSYSFLTAKLLNMKASFFGYGSTGVTCSGGGGVPRLAEAYKYIRDGVEYNGTADHIVINSGANDRGVPSERFVKCYREAVDVIRSKSPNAVIWVLSPFCGAFVDELKFICDEYNKSDKKIIYIDTKGWAPPEPLHPLYETNLTIAEKLADIIGKY